MRKNSNRRISQRSRVKHSRIISCKRGQSQALSCLRNQIQQHTQKNKQNTAILIKQEAINKPQIKILANYITAPKHFTII